MNRQSAPRPPILLWLLLVVGLFGTACISSDGTASGSDQSGSDEAGAEEAGADETAPTTAPPTSETATTEEEADGPPPARIVSLSPTLTEVAFAVGAGDQIIAVDSLSNFPPEAPVTDLVAFEPNLEAIAEYAPDLVLLGYDINDTVAGLEAVGIRTLVLPDPISLEGAYEQILLLGEITGHERTAASVVAEMKEGIAEIAAQQPTDGDPVRIYHELDETFFSVSASSFIGDLYAQLGVENIADEADGASGGYPQLSAEYILETDPQVIVITDQVAYGVDEVADRAGWDVISAVDAGNVVVVDADIASRWGPRVVEFLQFVSDAVAEARG